MRRLTLALAIAAILVGRPLHADTGYDLWLRYARVEHAAARTTYRRAAAALVVPGNSATDRIIVAELQRGLGGLLGIEPPVLKSIDRDGAIVVGTRDTVPAIARIVVPNRIKLLGNEGYIIQSAVVNRHPVTIIASGTEVGALRGTFHFLRLIQTSQPIAKLSIVERPRIDRRLLDHWDNLDRTIERGYAGQSLWNWDELPERVDPRIRDYARANASIGINGAVLNNVNANPAFLTAPLLKKVAALADVFRPYGIRVYLSANFAAPRLIGDLPTADPLDPRVELWWRDKAAEIYHLIPDFGGFLVKANSEGQPGPQDYGRTHADGANVLADAVAPYGGVVMWRAFVYNADVDPDRVKRAYLEFVPLDGAFRDNVIVQAKNGPLDFQPREPFNPLFGAMPKTPVMAELQITQEYLGQSTHLVYLAPMWQEFLGSETFAHGTGSLVSKVIDGSLYRYRLTGIAGVANTGSDANWTGHDFAQANWYAFGRLAWNPDLDSEQIANEWIAMTWGRAPELASTIRPMMLGSREMYVDYTMPLGLHHLIGGDHYAPMPENDKAPRIDWTAVYYHRADAEGIGFDRTTHGSNAVSQYHPPLREFWNDPTKCPDKLLLWFHHLPWDFRLPSNRTLWDELVRHYYHGAAQAAAMVSTWESLRGRVDDERHRAVLAKLRQQAADAAAWRDKCLKYFQQFSRRPIQGVTE